jgi:hypothetical protein
MRIARLQTIDLGRADNFLGSMVTKDDLKENDRVPIIDAPKPPQVNGSALPFRTDAKPRFSDPPAPPPQQPLPEKPDVARAAHPFEPSSPSLKRSNTERPRSVPNASPVRQESSSQIVKMAEDLANARKELDAQSARMRDLEEMLQKERHARELAEELAKRLEIQSEAKINGHAKGSEGSVMEDAFEPPSETTEAKEVEPIETVDPKAISDSSLLLEQRLEMMLVDMQELREQMESFKTRAETAESERDSDRKTLTEMVEKIRADEARRSSSTERAQSPKKGDIPSHELANGHLEGINSALSPLLQKAGLANGNAVPAADSKDPNRSTVSTLSRPPGGHDPLLYHATPYASMLGVVLFGMGLMAYLNGWQPPKVDR